MSAYFSATSTVRSVLPPSTTMVSNCPLRDWRESDWRHLGRYFSSFNAGTITETSQAPITKDVLQLGSKANGRDPIRTTIPLWLTSELRDSAKAQPGTEDRKHCRVNLPRKVVEASNTENHQRPKIHPPSTRIREIPSVVTAMIADFSSAASEVRLGSMEWADMYWHLFPSVTCDAGNVDVAHDLIR